MFPYEFIALGFLFYLFQVQMFACAIVLLDDFFILFDK